MDVDDRQTRVDACVVACAETFRGDGEILASAFGAIPRAGVALARLTFSPELLLTDGEARLIAEPTAVGGRGVLDAPIEGWLPFRRSFEMVWSGRRHALMGASQIDRYGNANLSVIGDWHHPKVQLIGVRGLPGNTLNHPCSYWVGRHSTRVFVENVDMVSGVGYDLETRQPGVDARYHEIRRVITDLAVFDFDSPSRQMRLRSLHPGVAVDEVVARTGFELEIPGDVDETRAPTKEEERLLREVIDPDGRCRDEITVAP